nr:MAG TPA: CI repressor [Caudoviricetes sp.]
MKTFSSEKIIERLKEALEINSDSALAERLKVTKGTLSNWKARNSLDFEKVFSVCDLISVDWLLTGKGEMLKSTKSKVIEEIEITTIHEPRVREKKEDEQIVYLYDFAATAGLKALFDNNKQNIIDTIKIPNLPKCDGAIQVVGDSMYPLLKSGDIILYKQIPTDVQNLVYGEMYLLSYEMAGEDYITVKYIRKSERGEPFITLASENPLHSPCDIDFNNISALALVKASIRINCMK